MENQESGQKRKGYHAEYLRHSKSDYPTDFQKLASAHPTGPIDMREQVVPDLNPEGIKYAEEQIGSYLETLDPTKDVFQIYSSDLARAHETAAVFAREARKRGFTIIEHEPRVRPGVKPETRGFYTERIAKAYGIGERDVRPTETLTLRMKDVLAHEIFEAASLNIESMINWAAAEREYTEKGRAEEWIEFRRQWGEARAYVVANDKGKFGANFFAHSEEINRRYPLLAKYIATSRDLYEKRFPYILKHIEMGVAHETVLKEKTVIPRDSTLHIVLVGHENAVGYLFDKYFSEHAIGNCEVVTFSPEADGKIVIEKKDKTAIL